MRIVTVVGVVDIVDNASRNLHMGDELRLPPDVGLLPLAEPTHPVERIGRNSSILYPQKTRFSPQIHILEKLGCNIPYMGGITCRSAER